jgi:PIN domain nuclease of toxin-antitoxin system
MILLDTHVWLWWVNLDRTRLKSSWVRHIESSKRVGVSAISCFEVAWLVRHKRIVLPCLRGDWFDKALTGSGIELLPITPEIASIAVDLPEHHSDPQDRLIIATALAHDADLISADAKFPRYTELAGKLLD